MLKFVASLALVLLACPFCFGGVLIEDFEAPFPAWESGWLGVNSNLQNYYVVSGSSNPSNRGNNPDGLWMDDGDGIYGTSTSTITFNPAFALTLTSFDIDVAGWAPALLEIFDASNQNLLSVQIALTQGAWVDPGVYAHYGVTSSNGIGGFRLIPTGGTQIEGNTGIDNVTVNQGTAPVPEPATWVLLGASLAGLGLMRRFRRR